MSNKKILIITGDGGESFEVLYAQQRLTEAGYKPIIAAPSARTLHLVIHDFEEGWDTYIERKGYGVKAEISFKEVNPDNYQAILLIGGRAPEYLRNNETVIKIVQKFNDDGKLIFAICHGVQILVTAGLVNHKNITCYEHVRFEVELGGGHYIHDQEAVRDGRIITGQTWQSHPEFYKLVLEALDINK